MSEHILLVTEGDWYVSIAIGQKKFDFRKGFRDIKVGDFVRFIESDKQGNPAGLSCLAKVNFVLHSRNFPEHFGWDGEEFTIIQFDIIIYHKKEEEE